MTDLPLFESCTRDIEAMYQRLGYTLGWRFLSVSRSVLASPVRIAMVTLNPGGDRIRPDHPSASCEDGVSYVVESWGSTPGRSPLQVQVQGLFARLQSATGYEGTPRQLMEESLIGHFIPFRSPRFADLPLRADALAFGRSLWRRLLPHSRPKLTICLGREVQAELRGVFPSALSARLEGSLSYPTGWGSYTADIDTFRTAQGEIARLLFLPHLSTWKLFTSDKCRRSVDLLIQAAAGTP